MIRGWPDIEVTVAKQRPGTMAWAVGVAVWVLAWVVVLAVAGVALLVAYLRYTNRSRARPCSALETMEGKTVLVTGNDEGEWLTK